MRTLVVSADSSLVTTFGDASRDFGIEVELNNDCRSLPDTLRNTKYEGVVVDFDTLPAALPAVGDVRKSQGNHSAVIFAVASDAERRDQALLAGAHFIVWRPLQKPELTNTLTAAYDLMRREHRRYFRCSFALPLFVKRISARQSLECSTI